MQYELLISLAGIAAAENFRNGLAMRSVSDVGVNRKTFFWFLRYTNIAIFQRRCDRERCAVNCGKLNNLDNNFARSAVLSGSDEPLAFD
jgi:hypothetical protein